MSDRPSMDMAPDSFAALANHWRPRIEDALERVLPPSSESPERLHAAMRYAMFPGGKRFRPLLAMAAATAAGADEPDRALRPAAALELVHTYSLIHDDLPCMDDDALRRGRPTCHRAFDEATALLAGDALLTLAFDAVADGGPEAVRVLAGASGSFGMVGGQVADLAAEGAADMTLPRLEWIHDRKTGALITASLEVGWIAAGGDPGGREPVRAYGRAIGRAFQIADDCLDVTGTAAELGKEPGQDAAHQKSTYPALLGLEESRREARRLAEEAAALAGRIVAAAGRRVDSAVALLQDLAFRVIDRRA